MSETVKSSTKEKYAGWAYICERQACLNSIGQFRCFGQEEDKPRCQGICDKCEKYYEEK